MHTLLQGLLEGMLMPILHFLGHRELIVVPDLLPHVSRLTLIILIRVKFAFDNIRLDSTRLPVNSYQ